MRPVDWKGILGLTCILGLFLTGCTSLLRKDAPRVERTLTEAGFITLSADTAERVTQLQALPPYKLVKRVKNGATRYMYADPTGCQCIYVGGVEQYTRYKKYLGAISSPEADYLEERMATEEEAQTLDLWDPL